jgi:hypothetical protein
MQANLRGFKVVLDGVTMRDWSWFADIRGYFPLVHGLEVDLRHVIVNSFSMPGGGGPAGNDPVLETQFEINPGAVNLLRAVVDTTGGTLTKQPLNLAASGGWSVYGQSEHSACIECRNQSGFFATDDALPRLAAGAKQTMLDGAGVAALRLVADFAGGPPSAPCALTVASPRIGVDAGHSSRGRVCH